MDACSSPEKKCPKKIGLVLAGGGAKGAYQIGVWKAFQTAGVSFDAIAGTSIGAFNAALIAGRNYNNATKSWMRLSTIRIAIFARHCVLAFFLLILQPFGDLRYRRLGIKERRGYIIMGVITCICIFLAAIFRHLFKRPLEGGIIGLLFGLSIMVIYYFAQPLYEKLNFGVLSHKTLKAILDRGIDWDQLASSKIPIFITVAQKYETSDDPIIKYRNVPEYLRLNKMTKEKVQNCLSASMALPFGLFSQVKIGSNSYMDGGLGDNTPVYPLIMEGCDKIYVVHLMPNPKEMFFCRLTDPDDLNTKILMIHDIRKKAGLYAPGIIQETQKAKITHIVPSKSLGFSLLGTLRFSRKKSEKLIKRGYEDAKTILKKEGYIFSET